MKNLRSLGLVLSALALLSLSCQTVTSMFSPSTPTAARARPAATAGVKPAATSPGNPTATPRAVSPTSAPGANAPTIGTLAESQQAYNDGSIKYLEELAAEQYSSADLQQMDKTFPYTLQLAQEQPLLWQFGWCATTPAILKQNLALISYTFSINGAPVEISQFYAYDSQSSDQLECHSYVAVLAHWPKGKTTLQTIVTFDGKLNDGVSDYPAGRQTFVYTVNR